MNKKLLLTLPLAVSLLALSACWEDSANNQKNADANTQISAQAEATQAPQDGAVQGQTTSGIGGIYCHDTDTHDTALVAFEIPDSKDIVFSFSAWNKENGHKCGTVDLHAEHTDNHNWVVSKADPYEEGAICTLTLSSDEQKISIQESGDCAQMCGHGERIGTLDFPKSAKIERPATENEIVGLFEGPAICP